MTPELTVLAYAALLQAAQFALVSVTANLELSPAKTMSPRDKGSLADQLSTKPARLLRAMNNHFEGLILFTIAVTLVTLADTGTGFTAICAWTYLGARILYVPAYYFGLTPWRSIVWFAGFLATFAMIGATIVQT